MDRTKVTRTEKRYLVVREDDVTIMAFAFEDMMKRGILQDKGEKIVVDHNKLMEDMPVYDRVLLQAFGMERKKEKKEIKILVEDLKEIEAKFFNILRNAVKDYYDFEAERRINVISAISWIVVLVGWIPFLLLKDTPIYPYLMWSWIFGAPVVAGLLTLRKPPLTPEGRKIVEEQTDDSIKKWKPENEFIKQLAMALKHHVNLWPEKIAAKGTGKEQVKVSKWF